MRTPTKPAIWEAAMCYRAVADLLACDPQCVADVSASRLTDEQLRQLAGLLATWLRAVRVALDTPEGAIGEQLGALLVELGTVPVVAIERVAGAVLRVLPLEAAPDLLSSCLDLLSDVGTAALLATEAIAGVQPADLDAPRAP